MYINPLKSFAAAKWRLTNAPRRQRRPRPTQPERTKVANPQYSIAKRKLNRKIRSI